MKQWIFNPVLAKEIKLRFRSVKSYVGISVYLAVLGLLVLGYMGIFINFETNHSFQPDQTKSIFMMLCMFQLGLLIFVTPGLTAGVISIERERQTLPILLTTDQSSTTIIISKMLASLAFLLLFIILSLPLYVIVFLYGGISPGLILTVSALFIFLLLIISSVGVWASTVFRKTIVAIVTTYGLSFFMTGGMAFIVLLLFAFSETIYMDGGSFPWPFIISAINVPIMLFSLFEPSTIEMMQEYADWNISPWWLFFGFYSVVIVLFVMLAVRKLRPNMKPRTKTIEEPAQ